MNDGAAQRITGSPIEEAYAGAAPKRQHSCLACCVSWFGSDAECWVCGEAAEGLPFVVPAGGSQSWSSQACAPGVDDEETAAFVRRMRSLSPPALPGHTSAPYL